MSGTDCATVSEPNRWDANLDDALLYAVLSRLSPRNLAVASLACQRWRQMSTGLWAEQLARLEPPGCRHQQSWEACGASLAAYTGWRLKWWGVAGVPVTAGVRERDTAQPQTAQEEVALVVQRSADDEDEEEGQQEAEEGGAVAEARLKIVTYPSIAGFHQLTAAAAVPVPGISDGGAPGSQRQPTWSPTGQLLATSGLTRPRPRPRAPPPPQQQQQQEEEEEEEGQGQLVSRGGAPPHKAFVLLTDRQGRRVLQVRLMDGFLPFYFAWSSCGNYLAMLSNWPGRRVCLRVLDVAAALGPARAAPRLAVVGAAVPLFLHWCPDAPRLYLHVGHTGFALWDAAGGGFADCVPAAGRREPWEWAAVVPLARIQATLEGADGAQWRTFLTVPSASATHTCAPEWFTDARGRARLLLLLSAATARSLQDAAAAAAADGAAPAPAPGGGEGGDPSTPLRLALSGREAGGGEVSGEEVALGAEAAEGAGGSQNDSGGDGDDSDGVGHGSDYEMEDERQGVVKVRTDTDADEEGEDDRGGSGTGSVAKAGDGEEGGEGGGGEDADGTKDSDGGGDTGESSDGEAEGGDIDTGGGGDRGPWSGAGAASAAAGPSLDRGNEHVLLALDPDSVDGPVGRAALLATVTIPGSGRCELLTAVSPDGRLLAWATGPELWCKDLMAAPPPPPPASAGRHCAASAAAAAAAAAAGLGGVGGGEGAAEGAGEGVWRLWPLPPALAAALEPGLVLERGSADAVVVGMQWAPCGTRLLLHVRDSIMGVAGNPGLFGMALRHFVWDFTRDPPPPPRASSRPMVRLRGPAHYAASCLSASAAVAASRGGGARAPPHHHPLPLRRPCRLHNGPPYVPSDTFGRHYLAFADQYFTGPSPTFCMWAPDSSAFCTYMEMYRGVAPGRVMLDFPKKGCIFFLRPLAPKPPSLAPRTPHASQPHAATAAAAVATAAGTGTGVAATPVTPTHAASGTLAGAACSADAGFAAAGRRGASPVVGDAAGSAGPSGSGRGAGSGLSHDAVTDAPASSADAQAGGVSTGVGLMDTGDGVSGGDTGGVGRRSGAAGSGAGHSEERGGGGDGGRGGEGAGEGEAEPAEAADDDDSDSSSDDGWYREKDRPCDGTGAPAAAAAAAPAPAPAPVHPVVVRVAELGGEVQVLRAKWRRGDGAMHGMMNAAVPCFAPR